MPKTAPRIESKSYIAPQLCEAAGIKPTTLRTWRARGLIKVAKDHDREWTRYSETDALRICALAHMVRSGVELNVAASILEDLELDERFYDGAPLYMVVTMATALPKHSGAAGLFFLTREVPQSLLSPDDPDDAVALIVDVAKIFRNARNALNGAS